MAKKNARKPVDKENDSSGTSFDSSDSTLASSRPSKEARGITALELAHLTATLYETKLIAQLQDEDDPSYQPAWNITQSELINAAVDFLQLCEQAQKERQENKIRNEKAALLREKVEQFRRSRQLPQSLPTSEFLNQNANIPISKALELAKVNRIVLNKTELNQLNIRESWEKLNVDAQQRAIYLCLIKHAHQPQLFGDEESLETQTTNEIPVTLFWSSAFVDALQQAKKVRESKIKSEAAKKSRLKRGHDKTGHFKASAQKKL
jgi:hypothetical protein